MLSLVGAYQGRFVALWQTHGLPLPNSESGGAFHTPSAPAGRGTRSVSLGGAGQPQSVQRRFRTALGSDRAADSPRRHSRSLGAQLNCAIEATQAIDARSPQQTLLPLRFGLVLFARLLCGVSRGLVFPDPLLSGPHDRLPLSNSSRTCDVLLSAPNPPPQRHRARGFQERGLQQLRGGLGLDVAAKAHLKDTPCFVLRGV